ncbi:MAG: ribonuclease HII [Armatimonadota bacterium]
MKKRKFNARTHPALPSSEFEDRARRAGYALVAGVDEAGRGALAGPVVAAAVILPAHREIPGLDDSKRLTPSAREALRAEIQRHAIGWAVGTATPAEVDELNVLRATQWAMAKALERLRPSPHYALVDGRPVRGLPVPFCALIDGDARSVSIAAASIVAKVERDRIMCKLDQRFPGYGFAQHKGYSTRQHRLALRLHGPCPIHRYTFRPVRLCAQTRLALE